MKIKAFGLELRSRNSIQNIYDDVNAVLAMAKIQPGRVSGDTQAMTVAHALQHMMEPHRWFCVSTVKQCAEVCHVLITAERMSVYSAIHCVSWNKMLPEYRQTIIAMVLDDFRTVLNPNETII